MQSEQNLAKEKKAVETLAVMLRQSHADNVAATANEKKLKEEKEFKGGVMACALSNLSKSTKSSSTTAPLLTTAPPQIFISSFSHALFLDNSDLQLVTETATIIWVFLISTIDVVQTTSQLVGMEPTFFISSHVILGTQKCLPSSTDFAKDFPASLLNHALAKDEMVRYTQSRTRNKGYLEAEYGKFFQILLWKYG